MNNLGLKFCGLSVAIFALLLLLSGDGGATTAPKVSGKYILSTHKICQAYFTGMMTGPGLNNDNDIAWEGFDGGGLASVIDAVGVFTFNSTKLTYRGSNAEVAGPLILQNLSALGITTANSPLTASIVSVSGTYSTGVSSLTITETGKATKYYQALYADIVSGVAHQAFVVAATTDSNGNSCAESGSLILQ
jgi:hypothetical protein